MNKLEVLLRSKINDKCKTVYNNKIGNTTSPIGLYVCNNNKRENCEYLMRINIDTEYLKFNKDLCGILYKK